MSSEYEVPGRAGPPRPVTIAVYTQFALGALGLISSVIGFIQTADTMNRMREATSGVEVDGVSPEDLEGMLAIMEVASYAIIVVSLLFAAAVAFLGIFNLKGKNVARIITWVLAGLGLACGLCGSVGGAVGMLGGQPQGTGDELTDAITRATADLPAWYNWSGVVFTVLDVVLYLAIIILLAVPASNDYFRKPKPEMDITLPPEAYMDAPPPPARDKDESALGKDERPGDDPEEPKR